MKKIYFALMCLASLAMMTACGGDKKAENANDAENTELVNDEDQTAGGEEAEAGEQDVLCTPEQAEPLDLAALYANGDFKPAATVIFEDNQSGEKAGELPSKWDLKEGSAEIGTAAETNYIALSGGQSVLFPMVNGSAKEFLPESYSMEFEFLFGEDKWYELHLYNNEDGELGVVRLWVNGMDWNFAKTDDESIHGNKDELFRLLNKKGWNHFALSYDKGNVKIFINGKRVANLPNVKPSAYFTIWGDDASGSSHFIKNIRVMK